MKNERRLFMKRQLVLFEEYEGTRYLLLETENEKLSIDEALSLAILDAKTNYPEARTTKVHEIPEKFLAKYGLRRAAVDGVSYLNNGTLRLNSFDEASCGYILPVCKYCSRFVDNFCYKYGNGCDPENLLEDCFQNEDAYALFYGDQSAPAVVLMRDTPVYSPLSPSAEELAILLRDCKDTNSLVSSFFKMEDYQPENWHLEPWKKAV
jgi:hypothetical protein